MPMAQQNARYLMSIVKKAATSKGAKVEGSSVNYLYQAYGRTAVTKVAL